MRKFLILLLVSLFSLASPVHADVDFSDKTITWVVPFKEGGGTSRFARFIQPFLTKYLPGNPDIQIMHIPGGGAIKGSNYFQKNAKPDGTFIFGCSTSVIVNVATGNPLVKYNLSEYKGKKRVDKKKKCEPGTCDTCCSAICTTSNYNMNMNRHYSLLKNLYCYYSRRVWV